MRQSNFRLRKTKIFDTYFSIMKWDSKNVLVTGSSGFLGSHLISLLKKKKYKKNYYSTIKRM